MRRHYEECVVYVFQGNGGEVQIREHAGLRIVVRPDIEDCDLDSAIGAIEETRPFERLQIQRLKKRKLVIKDRIIFLEDQLTPDIIA